MKSLSLLRARIRNAHPDHYSIAQGMAWVTLFVFLGKLAGAAKEMAIAWRYGVSKEVDAYIFVFNLVNWPVSVWFSVLTVVLVPLVARIRQETSAQLPRFRSELLGLTLLFGIVLTLLAWLGLPLLLRSSWTGLPDGTVSIATHIEPVLVFLVPLGLLISLFSAWVMAAGGYINTLLEGLPALVLLGALLIFSGGGAEPLVWGILAGFVLQLGSLVFHLARRSEIETPRFSRQSPQWPTFWRGFGIMLAGQTLMSFTTIIDQFFAAHLNTGAIATLSYCNRILSLILGLGAMAVARATLPVFSRIQVQGLGGQSKRIPLHWARLMFVLGAVTMIVGWWLVPWVVKGLFERGVFTVRDTQSVTEVLRYALVQLPFYFAGLVLVSLLASRGYYWTIAAVAILNLLVKSAANFTMVPRLGINGLVLSTAFMYMIAMSLFWRVVRHTR
jgi:putative peptidoglycan lipid II flippase